MRTTQSARVPGEDENGLEGRARSRSARRKIERAICLWASRKRNVTRSFGKQPARTSRCEGSRGGSQPLDLGRSGQERVDEVSKRLRLALLSGDQRARREHLTKCEVRAGKRQAGAGPRPFGNPGNL